MSSSQDNEKNMKMLSFEGIKKIWAYGIFTQKCFIIALSTLQKAINNNQLITWPDISEIHFKKLIKKLLPTAKGHLDQEQKIRKLPKILFQQKNKRRTTTFPQKKGLEKKNMNMPHLLQKNQKKTYTDLTGRFSHKSSRGNEYFFIMYDYDSNAILCEPLKNRQEKTITTAWENIHSQLTKHSQKTKKIVLENEFSAELKATMKKYNKISKKRHQIQTEEMLLNLRLELTKITLWQAWPHVILSFRSTNGIYFFLKKQ